MARFRERAARGLAGVALVFAVGGCERGCLSRWIADRSASPVPRSSSAGRELEGTDCSDGLLRCVEGRVEASRVAHVPHPCGAGKSGEAREVACSCPWDAFARCASGCAMDGVEVVAARSDAGAAQLCRPVAPVARPLGPGDPVPSEICSERGVTCVDGVVRTCEAPRRVVQAIAVCLRGCSRAVTIDGMASEAFTGSPADLDGVVAILCQRDQAERR